MKYKRILSNKKINVRVSINSLTKDLKVVNKYSESALDGKL